MNKQGAWQIVDNFLGLVQQSVTIVVNIPQWADSLVFNSKEYCIIHFLTKEVNKKINFIVTFLGKYQLKSIKHYRTHIYIYHRFKEHMV